LQRAISLLGSLSLEATVRAVRRPHSAFRQLLFKHFQADRIARRQGQSLDRRKPRLALLGLRQVSFRQTFLQRLAKRPTQTFLK
jgi:hypothetical protein